MNSAVLPEYLTIAEAAELLRVDKSTIRRWISSHRLQAHRIGERTIRIHRRDLDRVVDHRSQPNVSDAPATGKLTPEKRRQWEEALAESARILADQRERGIFFKVPSWVLNNEARDERTRQLSGE